MSLKVVLSGCSFSTNTFEFVSLRFLTLILITVLFRLVIPESLDRLVGLGAVWTFELSFRMLYIRFVNHGFHV